MRGAPHKGLAWLMRPIRSRISGHVRSSRVAPRFPCPIPGESSPVPTDDRVGLNHLQARAPTRPKSRQQNPQQSLGGLEAQATRPVLVENGQLVTKGENLHLQGATGPKP